MSESPTNPPHASVSVVVPSYNHAAFIERCLRSIFRQTVRPGKLLVIDDGSRDESTAIIERVLKECPFPCELIVQSNRGLSATLNEGLKRSSDEYFAYLGSDDLWLPEFLQVRIKTLEQDPSAVLAYGNAYSIDADDRIVDCTTEWAAYVDGDARRMLLTTLAPLSPTVVYRRSALDDGWNENSRLEDYEMYLRLSTKGRFAFDSRVLSAWRTHGANASLNVEMMLAEQLAAQSRVSTKLGMTTEELKRYQALARFRAAQQFVRRGEKVNALRLTLKNLRGIGSVNEAAKMLISLVLPASVVAGHREHRAKAAADRYGQLQI